eukprot:TRINITY_DN26092_c0_g3_i1.p1 TRINITY_DN26092_c0_g3~~TRINITY_DN26092_c0_g3_i1.p1  ORF type:complete len:397 (+),score=127.14 TRINITY_DN26092_c0_g3_i1:92-1192(+)
MSAAAPEEDDRDLGLFTGVFTTSFLSSQTQIITLLTILIHFLHPLLCMANYLDWVRHQGEVIGDSIVSIYLALCIIAILTYLLVSSVFYFWALRYASDEDAAKRRRIYGIVINLLFSDFPLFALEVDIVWDVQFATGLQALSFLFSILSFAYSAIRAWFFVMVRCIKTQQPTEHLGGEAGAAGGPYGAQGGFASAAPSPTRDRGLGGAPPIGAGVPSMYPGHSPGAAHPRVGSFTDGTDPASGWYGGSPAHGHAPTQVPLQPQPLDLAGAAAVNPLGGDGMFPPQPQAGVGPAGQLLGLAVGGPTGSPPRAGGIIPAGSDPQHHTVMLQAGAQGVPADGIVPQSARDAYGGAARGQQYPPPYPFQP